MAGQIAQFIVPSDAIGNPNEVVWDWPHNRGYFISDSGIRSYALTFATQSPILSVSGLPGSNTLSRAARCDANGYLIAQFGLSPKETVYKVDPNTLLSVATFGVTETFGDYPDTIGGCDFPTGICCTTAGGVPYAVIKEIRSSTHCGVIRTDTMTAAGFYGVVSTSDSGGSVGCAGAQGGAGTGTVYYADENLGAGTVVGIHKVTIGPSAPAYSIDSWPAPNPAISTQQIASISAAEIDAGFTTLTCNSIGYDAHDGVLVLSVSEVSQGGSGIWLIGVNAFTGALLWKANFTGDSSDLSQTRMLSGQLAELGNGNTAILDGVLAINGNSDTGTVIGLGNSTRNNSGDDVSQTIVTECSYSQSGGSLTPVSGTATSFSGWAMLMAWPNFPVPPPPSNDLVQQAAGPVSLGRWRTSLGINWYGMALVGDAYSGVMGLSNFEDFTEYGNPMRFLITTPPIHDDRKRIFMPRFEIEVEAGEGIDGQPGVPPQMLLEWSKDGGKTWSTLQPPRSMGLMGEYIKRLRWLNLGQSRTWIFRLTCTDPVRRYIIGAYTSDYKSLG